MPRGDEASGCPLGVTFVAWWVWWPVAGSGSDPVVWLWSCVPGGSDPLGAGLVSGFGLDSGCGPESGSGSGFGTSPCSLGIWIMPGPSFVLDSGPVLFGGGPDFGLGSGLAFLVLIPSGPGFLDLAPRPWCFALDFLIVISRSRVSACGLLLSAPRSGPPVFGALFWAFCVWFPGLDFSVLVPWPWLFGPGLVVSAGWSLSFDLVSSILAFWSGSPDLGLASGLGSSGLCPAGAVCGRDGCALGQRGSCSQDGCPFLVACLSDVSFFVGLGSACGNSVIFLVPLVM